jgi:hypothetical protein
LGVGASIAASIGSAAGVGVAFGWSIMTQDTVRHRRLDGIITDPRRMRGVIIDPQHLRGRVGDGA